jgi:hypothetical protein
MADMVTQATNRPISAAEEGPARTRGRTYRAHVEKRQRQFRVQYLNVGYQKWGHLLDPRDAEKGANFIHPDAFAACKLRLARMRGIHPQRTLANMLSSHALSFNLFGPLASPQGMQLASGVLRRFVADVNQVTAVRFDYVPPPELFHDRAEETGVDCDVLVEYKTPAGADGLLAIETKFVETEFASCAFRAPGLKHPCMVDAVITDESGCCRYVSHKGYSYWERANQLNTLRQTKTPLSRCALGGSIWQLYVNHTLAHAVAAHRRISRVTFGVCAPLANDRLMARPQVEAFASLLTDPKSVVLLPLEELIDDITRLAPSSPAWQEWVEKLRFRYMVD